MEEKLLELLKENPELIVEIVKGAIEKYKPTVYGCLNELFEIYKDYANNKEIFATEAKIKKNTYDAFIEVGFTEDQALALMINDNIRLMNNLKKLNSSSSSVAKSPNK